MISSILITYGCYKPPKNLGGLKPILLTSLPFGQDLVGRARFHLFHSISWGGWNGARVSSQKLTHMAGTSVLALAWELRVDVC